VTCGCEGEGGEALNVTSTNQLRDAFPADMSTNKQIHKPVPVYEQCKSPGN